MPSSHPTRWITLLVLGALTAFGCVGTTDTGQQGETGSLAVDLVLAGGIEIDQVSWQITGNDMDMSGDIDVSAPGSTASVEVFGLPPTLLERYTVKLTATSTNEKVTCEGSADFDVEVGQSTNVMVMLNCKKPRTLGGVRVNGKFNICTELTKVVVSPLQTSVGNDISLAAQAFDEEGDDIHYIWSGDGGSIADPSAASTTYTCQDVGEHMVTILVTDNDVYCRMATWTVPVTCVPGDVIDLCEDVECPPDGNQCTEAACEPSSGECITSNVDDGTLCEIVGVGDGICSNGQCVEIDLCEDVECNDDNECTNDACDPVDGECDFTNVDNGTSCADDTGTCIDGACMVIIDKCEAVVCDDTGNDCTEEKCNQDTGICDEMNVPDGTECNGGAGSCSAGVCMDNNLCIDVDCTSDNDCVQDGTCDPSDGECIAGDNEPADTPCNADSGDVCDGNGACVQCNIADQCPDDGNECTAAACESDACVQNNVMDGQACDFGGSDGICEAGTCVEAPQCISPGDCNDGNPCTVGACPDGMCVYTPVDGVSCEVSAGVPGTCTAGDCVGLCVGSDCTSDNQCVMDGTCNDQTGSCVPGGNEPADTICTENGGSVCDGAGTCVECNVDIQCDVELNETCVDNTCIAEAAPTCNFAQTGSDTTPQSELVSQGCTNSVTTAQSPFPYTLIVDVPVPVVGGAAFTANLDGIGVFPEFFLDAAQGVVPGGVDQAILEDFLATVQVRSGATGPDVGLRVDISSLVPGPTQFCQYPPSTVCTADVDCIVPPCNPPVNLATIPTSTDCSVGGVCDTLGKKVSQCDLNGFCVTGGLVVDLQEQTGIAYTADATGPVLWGWGDTGVPGLITCPAAAPACTGPGQVDGCYDLPAAVFSNTLAVPGSGIRVNVAGALFVAIQCAGASDGGICASGEGCIVDADCATAPCTGVGADDDVVCPTPDADLISCPIN